MKRPALRTPGKTSEPGAESPAFEPESAAAGGALARGLRILQALVEATRPLSASEIAQACGLDVSTTQRLLKTLLHAGYALRDARSKRYLASPNVIFPLPLYHPWNVIRRDALPAILALRDKVGLTAGIVAFPLRERILLELAPGRDPLTPDYRTWMSSPLHASGSGKVLLASLAAPERQALLGAAPLKRYTDFTLSDRGALDKDLAQGHGRGYFFACDDYIVGLRVAAAPVHALDGGVVGCFFAAGGSASLPDGRLDEIGRAVKQSADLFSHASQSFRSLNDFVKACLR
jgi:IclR family acetate operon transcriptional repressor